VSMASRFWLMLTFQIMAYFAKIQEVSPKARLVRSFGEPGRLCKITMNRRIRRKLARMQRLGQLGAPTVSVHEPTEDDDLSATQYIEKMIRTRKWSRVRIFGLNRGRRVPNKGGVLSFGLPAICNAILTPE